MTADLTKRCLKLYIRVSTQILIAVSNNIPFSTSGDSDDPDHPMHFLIQCQRTKSVGGKPTIRAMIAMMASLDIIVD